MEVQVDGLPIDKDDEEFPAVAQLEKPSGSIGNPICIWIDIRISNGLHLSQKNLSYQDLLGLIEKLEGLC